MTRKYLQELEREHLDMKCAAAVDVTRIDIDSQRTTPVVNLHTEISSFAHYLTSTVSKLLHEEPLHADAV